MGAAETVIITSDCRISLLWSVHSRSRGCLAAFIVQHPAFDADVQLAAHSDNAVVLVLLALARRHRLCSCTGHITAWIHLPAATVVSGLAAPGVTLRLPRVRGHPLARGRVAHGGA